MSLLLTGLACTSTFLLFRYVQMVRIGRKLKAHTYWMLPDTTFWRILLPTHITIPCITYGIGRPHQVKHSEFAQAGMDGYVQMALTDYTPYIFLADPQGIKDITRPRSGVVQEIEIPGIFFGIYGPNTATLEGDAWKHHRRIVQRAFTEKNIQLVWSETVFALEQLFTQWDKEHGSVVKIPKISSITETLALMVISSAALGQRMSWKEEPDKAVPSGFSVSFQRAINIVSSSIFHRLFTPRWADGLTTTTRNVSAGFRDFGKYLHSMIDSYRRQGELDQSIMGTKGAGLTQTENVFSVLMAASEEDVAAAGRGLTDDEIAGNAFQILFAGHETTAHAIAFAIGLLAAYPEVQKEVYAQIKSVLGTRKSLTYVDINQLGLVTGAFLESLRMYPVVPQMNKVVEQDIVISVARNGPGTDENDRVNIPAPAGSMIIMSTHAMHYHPRYWPEPEEFRPARFCEAYNKDAFAPFSAGRRLCIGKRFAETEGAAALATFLAKYEISIDTAKFPTIPGETIHERRERLLRPYQFITMVPENMPLVFTRRS